MSGHVAPRAIAALLAAALALAPGAAQAQRAPAVDAFLREVGLTPDEAAGAPGAAPLVRELPTRERREVAVLGVVAVPARYERVRARMADVRRWTAGVTGRAAVGEFSTPAVPDDARALRLDGNDIDALRDCRPGHCDVKASAAAMDTFQTALDWDAPTLRLDAEALVRARLARYVNAYRELGDAAMVTYADGATPVSAAAEFARLLDASPCLVDGAPALARRLRDYPRAELRGATDALLWMVDRTATARPVTSVEHAVEFEMPEARLALLAEKQLYASHYFDGSLALTALTPTADGDATLLIVVRRYHFDALPAWRFVDLRGRIVHSLEDALTRELARRASARSG